MRHLSRVVGVALPALFMIIAAVMGCSDGTDKTTGPEKTPPALLSIRPDTVVAGTTAHISGERLGDTHGSSQLLFGSRLSQSITWSPTRVLAVVPDDVESGELSVMVNGDRSNLLPYRAGNRPPLITRIEPDSGRIGETIRIQGRLFGVAKKDGKVLFDEIEAVTTAWNDTSLQVTIPAEARTGAVRVQARGLESNAAAFTLVVTSAPLIEAVVPDSGVPGTGILIRGRGFGSAEPPSGVRLAGAAAGISSWTDTEIEAAVPWTAAPGHQTVQVTAAGVVSNAYPFKVLQPQVPVVITRLEPTRTTVSDIITIYGTGFRNETLDPIVTFQGAEGRIQTTITVWDEASIRAWVPQGAVDGPVVVQFGEAASNEVFFSVAPRRYTFTGDMKPLFQAKGCLGCHAGAAPSANLNLETKANLLRGDSDHGPVVLIRNGPGSILVHKLGPTPPFGGRMPQGCTTNCLSDEEILTVSDWIDEGTDN